MITVVDYGIGNLGAIVNMLDYLGFDACASGDPAAIERADRLILPGVGAFDRAMKTLRERDLLGPLATAVLGKATPVLGVCLGMQLLARRSEEGIEEGLGWIKGDVKRITPRPELGLKVPHVGWADVSPSRPGRLFASDSAEHRFYFTHSYHLVCDSASDVAASVAFSPGTALCCAVERGNVMGVQFHPERSHSFGLALFRRFVG